MYRDISGCLDGGELMFQIWDYSKKVFEGPLRMLQNRFDKLVFNKQPIKASYLDQAFNMLRAADKLSRSQSHVQVYLPLIEEFVDARIYKLLEYMSLEGWVSTCSCESLIRKNVEYVGVHVVQEQAESFEAALDTLGIKNVEHYVHDFAGVKEVQYLLPEKSVDRILLSLMAQHYGYSLVEKEEV